MTLIATLIAEGAGSYALFLLAWWAIPLVWGIAGIVSALFLWQWMGVFDGPTEQTTSFFRLAEEVLVVWLGGNVLAPLITAFFTAVFVEALFRSKSHARSAFV